MKTNMDSGDRKVLLMQLTIFLSKVYDSINRHEYTVAIYLDFSKAFDMVNHLILKQKLENAKLDYTSLQWFNLYLENRTQRVTANGVISNSEPSIMGYPSVVPWDPYYT